MDGTQDTPSVSVKAQRSQQAEAASNAGAGTGLGAVLEDLFRDAGRRPQDGFLAELVKLIAALTNARTVVAMADSGETALCTYGEPESIDKDAEAIRRTQGKGGVVVASPTRLVGYLAISAQQTTPVSVAMPAGNQVAMALAHERLETVRILCALRASGTAANTPPGLIADAAAFLASREGAAQSFVDRLAVRMDAPFAALAKVDRGQVGAIWLSGQEKLTARGATGAALRSQIEGAMRARAPDLDVLLLGGEVPTHALVIEGKAQDPRIARPLAELFSTAAQGRPRRRLLRRMVIGAAIGAAVFGVGIFPVADGVNLPATVSSSAQRIVTAPFDGRIAEVLVKEGERVTGGQTILAIMDARRLDAEMAQARADLSAAAARRNSARGRRDAAELSEAAIDAERAVIRMRSLEEQRARAEIIAPIDGIVRSEALETRASSYIGLGGVILEVIDPSALRVDVDVTTRARGRLAGTSSGVFRPDAAPTDTADFTLRSIAIAPDTVGRTVIYKARSEQLPNGAETTLQPGMRGVARFEYEDIPLAVLAWRRLRDWALLTLWL